MTREEAKDLLIHILMTYEPKDQYGDLDDPEPYEQAVTMAIEALSADAEQTDCTDFVNWLLEEVMDEENWQMNAVANGEIICRKLKKLGLLEVKDGYYIRPSAEAEIVLCKDCKHHHYSSDNIPYCDRQDYGYGWKDNDYCSRGKRRGDGERWTSQSITD